MKKFLIYVMGLMYFRTKGTCLDMSELLVNMSHDSLNRFIKAEWDGQKRLDPLIEAMKIRDGYLIFDDTPCEKPYARALEGLSQVYCTKFSKTMNGYSTVTMLWTNGSIRIPISLRLWRPGGKTKIQLALEMLSYARNHLGLKPKFVLFDTWYAAKAILKRIQDYGWCFVTRLKSNRLLDGKPLRQLGWRNNWKGVGTIKGGLRVFVVKNGNKFFATNRLTLARKELLSAYSKRSIIEEFHRIIKQECSFSSCQVRSFNAQQNHRWCSVFCFLILELERDSLGISIYKLRKIVCKKDPIFAIPIFEQILAAA